MSIHNDVVKSDFPDESWDCISSKIDRLSAKKTQWGDMKPSRRLAYLKRIKSDMADCFHNWGVASVQLQGWDMETRKGQGMGAMEGLVTGMAVKAMLDSFITSYKEMAKHGDSYASPAMNLDVSKTSDGRFKVHIPASVADRMLLKVKTEVYVKQGVDPTTTNREVNTEKGKVAFVMGAGNQNFLAISDVLNKLFLEGQVVLLKHHPLRKFGKAPCAAMFGSLIRDGFFEQTVCGIPETNQSILDGRVDTIHMTGGKPTHDLIVGNMRKHGQVKPFTSELGCVTPWIVVSGGEEWTKEQMDKQIAGLVLGIVSQQSCNCLAPKVLVVDSDWPQREEYIQALESALEKAPHPPAYYPGTRTRYDTFIKAYQASGDRYKIVDAKAAQGMDPTVGQGKDLRYPNPTALFYHDIDLEDMTNVPYAVKTEAFGPVFAICSIKGGANDPATFMPKACDFVNTHLFGSLSCTVVVHPSIEGHQAVEHGLDNLHYGCVVVNAWSALGFSQANGVWGGYPGETIDNVESGIGFVNNGKLIPSPEKAVVRLPFSNSMQVTVTDDFPTNPKLLRSLGELLVKPSFGRAVKAAKVALVGR